MQPTDHTSMAPVYPEHDSRSSGARYHRVTTYSVMISWPWEPRARPKSQIFRSQFALTSRLEGFRSRCSTLALRGSRASRGGARVASAVLLAAQLQGQGLVAFQNASGARL